MQFGALRDLCAMCCTLQSFNVIIILFALRYYIHALQPSYMYFVLSFLSALCVIEFFIVLAMGQSGSSQLMTCDAI